MMRNITSFFLLFAFSQTLFSQISIWEHAFDWKDGAFVENLLDGTTAERLTFSNAIHEGTAPFVPIYAHRTPVNSYGKLKITIQEVNFLGESPHNKINISVYENRINDLLTNTIEFDYRIDKNRDKYFAKIYFTPIVRNNDNTISYVKSIKLRVEHFPEINAALRSPIKENSVLREGEIYKIKIAETGIHSISGAFLADELGINLSDLDVDKIQLFSNPGGQIPLMNSDERPDDLHELSVFILGGEDGTMNSGDKILFYAEGAERWTFTENDSWLSYIDNPFDYDNYVFLRVGAQNGKRISTNGSNVSDVSTVDNFINAVRHEKNETNLLESSFGKIGSGQEWYGEYFDQTKVMDFTDELGIDQVEPGTEANLRLTFAGRAASSSILKSTVGSETFSISFSRVYLDSYTSNHANLKTMNETFILNDSQPEVSIDYSSNPSAVGWLDYLEFQYRRKLILDKPQLLFNTANLSSENQFNISLDGFQTSMQVWDVTNFENQYRVNVSSNGSSSYFTCNNNQFKSFVAFDPNKEMLKPISGEKIENQNLHGIMSADMVIITTEELQDEAQRLADHRSQLNDLDILVVNIETIYNEFSCGRREPTAIRDFARMIYDRDPSFLYLLLFGNGSYDYKGILHDRDQFNKVPVYETRRSNNAIYTFPSDDFFGLLSPQDGNDLKGEVDLAVGRIPVYTVTQANTVVNKIIQYDTDPTIRGPWNLRSIFAADDEDNNIHIDPAERISESFLDKNSSINLEKIYFDSYPQVSTPGGERYPTVTEEIDNNMFRGALTFCYLGHGGPTGWAQERVLLLDDVDGWNNTRSFPLFITATCSLASYDDPEVFSAGEKILVSKNGGIGLFTTSRAVYSNENERLTRSVHNFLLEKQNGEYLGLGEILRQAKNSESADTLDVNARKFLLIGDPSMKLLYPKYDVVTTAINDVDVVSGSFTDTISALSKMSIAGYIADGSEIMSNFNGEIDVTVFDKRTQRKTLEQDEGSWPKSFKVQKNVIFRGKAAVTNGLFSLEFVVPKDILFEVGNGKISYYATDGKNDATGNYANFLVGGSSKNPIKDDTPPVVEVFMNDENFVFGGITDSEPILYAKISDDIGINLSGASVGHDLSAQLDDDNQENYYLNDYFETELNDFTTGIVRYPLSELEVGKHKIEVRAWDIANNPGEGFTEFLVSDNGLDGLAHVLNYPNPFTDNTCFMFEHNMAPDVMDIQINIYTVSGKLVKTIDHNTVAEGYRITDIKWDGNDDFGSPLARGVYLYKIKVRAASQNQQKESDYEKLVILK